jgi:glycosyltransferase involved in cell wall biosynthesis
MAAGRSFPVKEPQRSVSVVLTVRNDREGCAVTLASLRAQRRQPDEIVVVDGGSDDGTLDVIQQAMKDDRCIRLMPAAGANIARGRNIGIKAAKGEIIATTDAGCRAESDWLANLVRPFEEDASVEFVAGFYRIEPRSLLEEVVGLATMRGQLTPVDPESFNPSARSVAYTKALWSRAGGLPEWIGFSEDTLFDHKIRTMGANWRFAGDAIVHWRPRSTLRAIARQFYHYGTGRGHTQIGARDFAYNIRNALLLLASLSAMIVTLWAGWLAACVFLYFHVYAFHDKAARIARRTQRKSAYPLCLVVMWTVLFSNLAGYLVGSWQRRRKGDTYRRRMETYLASAQQA